MLSGLLLGIVLSAPPAAETSPPTISDAHKDALARFGTAIWNLRRDRLLTTARQLEEAAKKDPDATAPLRELMRVYILIGREPEAIRVARKILSKNPNDFDVAQTLTRLLFEAGDLKQAVAAAKEAAEIPIPLVQAEKSVGVYRDLATLCEKANDHATAETAICKAIELVVDRRKEVLAAGAFTPHEADTAAAECLERLGKILIKQQKHDEAIAAFIQAARLFGDKSKVNDASAAARLNWNLSGVLQAKGEPKAALDYLEIFLKLQPISPEPYARLAKLLREADREVEIIPTLNDLENRDQKNLAIKAVLAAERARLGDPLYNRMAIPLSEKILAQTNDPKIVAVVIRTLLDSGHARELVAELDRLFTIVKDRDKDDKVEDGPEHAAAKSFAAEKARVIAEILNADARGSMAILQAATLDLRAGTKRSHQTYYFLACIAARHHELVLAAILYRDALQGAAKETRGDAYIGLIDVYRMAGKYAELAEICRDGLQNAETVPQFYFHYFLSEALAELGEDKAALATADQAIQETGHNDRLTVRIHKVRILNILERWDDAIALCQKLLEEFPDPADRLQTRQSLATSLWAAGKRSEAEAEWRTILEVDPENAPACNDLGFHLADCGRNLEEAENLIRTAIMVDRFERKKSGTAESENASYIDSLGWVLFRRGKLVEARVELERAAALYSGGADTIVWDHLGDVLYRLGEKAKAKAAWEKAEEIISRKALQSKRSRDPRGDELKRKLKLVP
jgi:tetratricopeptide (TPR) repeat protein